MEVSTRVETCVVVVEVLTAVLIIRVEATTPKMEAVAVLYREGEVAI